MASTRPQLSERERVARVVFTRLAAEADAFEGYPRPHAARVAAIAEALAARFGLGREDRANLGVAALAHDLGELSMGRDYIGRGGPLSDEERLDLARHPVIGEQEAARSGADRGAQLLVRWHHEWWDGTGYPDALRREQIPLPARILRAADSYAALTDDRPFRRALAEEAARRHLAEWAGIEFDPRVVRALLSLTDVPELRSYARSGEGGGETRAGARESAGVDRAEVDRPGAEREPSVRAEDTRAGAGGAAGPGAGERGVAGR
jgi:HD-GYP domain-containing protein (c-di-GMP phosphodiesterase class II)